MKHNGLNYALTEVKEIRNELIEFYDLPLRLDKRGNETLWLAQGFAGLEGNII
jgi:hypothetical protein